MSDASVTSKSVLSRSIQLLLDVERVLDSEPSKLQIVLDVLRDELTIESLLDEIQKEYGESYDHHELMVFGFCTLKYAQATFSQIFIKKVITCLPKD